MGPEVEVLHFRNASGQLVQPDWKEVDWEAFEPSSTPTCVFQANRYPYQVKVVGGSESHPYQMRAQHWVLWYLHVRPAQLADPSDEEINANVQQELGKVIQEHGFDRADYIWYRNPSMSVPDMFHVQVFWIVPA